MPQRSLPFLLLITLNIEPVLSQNQLKKIDQQKIINRYEYLGMMPDYHTISKDVIQTIVYVNLTPTQAMLFKRVLHGMNAYKPEEVGSMHWDKKRRIKKVWKRGQNVINRMKQRLTNKRVNQVLNDSVWAHTSVIKQLTNMSIDITDDTLINRLSLKDLGIQYEDLIIKFYHEGLLPKNYFELK
ncbi:MAG: hypothetical protein ACKVK1_01915 [Flavobacteriales bacterium]